MELNATGQILIEEGVEISLRGGTVFVHPEFGANFSGGAGSGGAIKLIGSSIENYGVLDVRGGDAAGADSGTWGSLPSPCRRCWWRGRIAMLSGGPLIQGVALIDGGKENAEGASGLPGTLFIGLQQQTATEELVFDSGTLVFDTAGAWAHSSGRKGKGKVQYHYKTVDGFPYGYRVCEFEFSRVELGKEVSVVVRGNNALRIKTPGDLTIGTDFSLDGKTGKSGIYSGTAGPGGWNSGRSLSNADFPSSPNSALSGMGPGGGIGYHDYPPSSTGGSYGGHGSTGANSQAYSNIYGDNNITQLVGGSGGARSGGRDADGGGGGGISPGCRGILYLRYKRHNISKRRNGGTRGSSSGAGGSGGSIRIEAANISNLGRIEAMGRRYQWKWRPRGGGRITLITGGTLVEGNYSVSGGSNIELAEEQQASDGIFSKILSPALPVLSDRNFTFEEIISNVDLGLISGLSYELSGLPQGIYLTDDLKLSGTPTHAGIFPVIIRASNRFGETNDTFLINVASGTPSVSTLAATAVGSVSALLHADVNSSGGENGTLSFTYGTNQGNLNFETNSSIVSTSGTSSILLTGLDSNQTYFFRAHLENSLIISDAETERNFTTLLNQAPPIVEIGPASKISDNNATVSYKLVSYDSSPP